MLVEKGPESILKAFTAASSFVMHRRVVYEANYGTQKGVTAGLDENGFLRVRDDAGTLHTVYAGGVRPDL